MEEKSRQPAEGLRGSILSEIEEKGPIPFSRFMELCLYHPEFGYYQRNGRKIGKEGDYFTSSCVNPIFGYLLSKQLAQMSEILGGEVFEIVEMGAGRGFLCQDILRFAKEKLPSFYRKLRYKLIERSPFFLAEQKSRLAAEEREGKLFWLDSESLWEQENRFEGCFLSNELVDAFPVHRVMLEKGRLKELYVIELNGKLSEQWGDPSNPNLSSYFAGMGVSLEEGQKAEVNFQALDWLENVGRSLKRGFVLTIDYGTEAEELYAPCRGAGTLLCYFRHQASENPFERLGEQDITSHVNFTALIKKGEEIGLRPTGIVPQYRFLMGLDFLGEMERMEKGLSEIDALQLRLSLKHLIEPEAGMGEVYKVLIQHKGIESPKLDGMRELRTIQ